MTVTMKSEAIILFLVVIAATSITGLLAEHTPALEIRYGDNLSLTETLPTNTEMAKCKSWVSVQPPADTPFPNLELWCNNDYILCVWFYQKDTCAGLQLAFPEDKFTNAAYDYKRQGFLNWTVSGKKYLVTSQYYLSPEVLSGAQTLDPSQYADQSIAANVVLKHGFVWVQGFNAELMPIPTTTSAIKDTLFTKQGCQNGKGQHFLYNLTSSGPECSADTILHWFPMTDKGELVAIERFFIATVELLTPKDWYQRPPLSLLAELLPAVPSCMVEEVMKHGVASMQMFFAADTSSVTCPTE